MGYKYNHWWLYFFKFMIKIIPKNNKIMRFNIIAIACSLLKINSCSDNILYP